MTSLMVEHLAYNEGVSGSSPLSSTLIFYYIFIIIYNDNDHNTTYQCGEIGIHAGFRFRSVKGKGSSPFTGIIFL